MKGWEGKKREVKGSEEKRREVLRREGVKGSEGNGKGMEVK